MKQVNTKKMKQVGLIRSIDELGRLVIPMEFRKIIGIDTHDRLQQNLCIDESGEYVILVQKYKED